MSAVSPSKAPPPASRQVEVPSIERETELIARAQRALAGGRASEALSILAAYGREFPRGALLEEAAGARVVALCQAHSGQAEAARLDFLETYPSSPLATRLSSVCKAKAP
jgi:outer membrane protein assembly factor BamD (BamD/ComL family)